MSFLLDTNVVSEVIAPRPTAAVLDWLGAAAESELYVSVVTLAELRSGAEQARDPARRSLIELWLTHDFAARFGSRLLPIDAEVADVAGRMYGRGRAIGRPVPIMDGLIGATAVCRNLTVVTGNEKHFGALGIPVLNPWSG